MHGKLLIRRVISSCLMVAIVTTYSMVAFASSDKASGELTISGNDASFVTINGETATSGRTIFSSSTISTPDSTTATVDLGKAGAVLISPNASLVLSFDNNTAHIDVSAGTVTALRANQPITVNAAGQAYALNAGESASAGGKDDHDYRDANGKCIDANHNGQLECDDHGSTWWIWALVFGGAAAVIVVTATNGKTNIELGGSSTTISPNK